MIPAFAPHEGITRLSISENDFPLISSFPNLTSLIINYIFSGDEVTFPSHPSLVEIKFDLETESHNFASLHELKSVSRSSHPLLERLVVSAEAQEARVYS